ncbi:ABC transporter ATP-binding protein [Pseudalkalibacillus decolorationis]|uniref:ABC transporter ATP-binding protein n=1 Tax=Pseudalkalibacillus decolorationis TaxID=163879 RepID=UPI003557159F
MKEQASWKQLIQLIRMTNPPKVTLGIAMVLSVITTFAGLAIPLLTSRLIDHFSLADLNTTTIIWIVVAFILQAVAGGVSVYFLAHTGQRIISSLRERLWNKLLILPVSYYDQHETGDTVSRITNDTSIIKNLITDHLTGFVTGLISIIGTIGVLLFLDWRLTLVMFSIIPLSLIVVIPIGKKMVSISRSLQNETAKFSATATRVLAEIRLVKASNAEDVESNRGQDGIKTLYRFGIKEGIIQAIMAPMISSMIIVVLVFVIGYGGLRVSQGEMTAGELVAFFIYLFQIIMPITQIGAFFTEFQKTIGATEKVISILEQDEEKLSTGELIKDKHKSLSYDSVSFGYDSTTKVIDDVSFTVNPGTVTAIVGPSGSGKTTLFALFEQFYNPNNGVIKWGDIPIPHFSLRAWRREIGYVSQESPLYAGTIRENILYGSDTDKTEEELKSAAQMAYADFFIDELPNGYETEVGERGIKLSGGQRQRIAIARALLRDPHILMLDEATSSLDSQSEVVVQQALNNLMKGRSTLVIAHRLSTVVNADQIVFLEKGKITGVGTHEELLRNHELYREFAIQQLQTQQ